ncbi:hypothetical protein QGC_1868, partial [Clostridioides difficile CD196]
MTFPHIPSPNKLMFLMLVRNSQQIFNKVYVI